MQVINHLNTTKLTKQYKLFLFVRYNYRLPNLEIR